MRLRHDELEFFILSSSLLVTWIFHAISKPRLKFFVNKYKYSIDVNT